MKKEFTRKKSKRKLSPDRNAGKTFSRLFLAIVLLATMGAGMSLMMSNAIKKPFNNAVMTAYVANLSSWMSERKTRFHKSVAKVKQLAVNTEESEKQIHFEFYTTLPKMQVTVSEPIKSDPIKPSVSPVKTIAAKPTTVRPDDLDKELASQFSTKSSTSKG